MSSSFDTSKPSFFTNNSNFHSIPRSESDAPKRKALSEINTNVANTNFQYCEKEQMFLVPPTQNKFQGFQFKPNNSNWFDTPQYSPQNNLDEADDWPDFI